MELSIAAFVFTGATTDAHRVRHIFTATVPIITFLTTDYQLFALGNLTPPAAPAHTMKRLRQVEPRTLVSSIAHTNTSSGTCYLTGNLSLPNGRTNGILIAPSNVSIDLMGFALISGPGNGKFLNGGNSNDWIHGG